MGELTKEKLELWLVMFVAGGTTISLIASMAHMLEAFGWANSGLMAWALALVAVVLNGVFIALWTISQHQLIRRSIMAGMVLLFLVEFFGNFAAGGLLVSHALPEEMSTLFFDLDRLALIRIGTFLFAAFLPILNFISVYALSEAGLRLVDQSGKQAEEANPWANLVMQRHETSQPSGQPSGQPHKSQEHYQERIG
ncbi:MAG: hypothetical protein WCS37_19165 [Chloroflexota bacterium]|nr:hypothetical protein [Chloroflexota bacterium]